MFKTFSVQKNVESIHIPPYVDKRFKRNKSEYIVLDMIPCLRFSSNQSETLHIAYSSHL